LDGLSDGVLDGGALGLADGDSDDPKLGDSLGFSVGFSEGFSVGASLDVTVGDGVAAASVGAAVEGFKLGGALGASLEVTVGDGVAAASLGPAVDGFKLGGALGILLGASVPAKNMVGFRVGESVGESVCSTVGLGRGQFLYPLDKISVGSSLQPPVAEQQHGLNSSGTSSRQGLQQALKLPLSEDPALLPFSRQMPPDVMAGSKPSQQPQKSGFPAE